MLAQERDFFPIMHFLCTGLESVSVYLHVLVPKYISCTCKFCFTLPLPCAFNCASVSLRAIVCPGANQSHHAQTAQGLSCATADSLSNIAPYSFLLYVPMAAFSTPCSVQFWLLTLDWIWDLIHPDNDPRLVLKWPKSKTSLALFWLGQKLEANYSGIFKLTSPPPSLFRLVKRSKMSDCAVSHVKYSSQQRNWHTSSASLWMCQVKTTTQNSL